MKTQILKSRAKTRSPQAKQEFQSDKAAKTTLLVDLPWQRLPETAQAQDNQRTAGTGHRLQSTLRMMLV